MDGRLRVPAREVVSESEKTDRSVSGSLEVVSQKTTTNKPLKQLRKVLGVAGTMALGKNIAVFVVWI